MMLRTAHPGCRGSGFAVKPGECYPASGVDEGLYCFRLRGFAHYEHSQAGREGKK